MGYLAEPCGKPNIECMAMEEERDALRARLAEAEREKCGPLCEQTIEERDLAQDALDEAWHALGGGEIREDGWVGRIPWEPAPYSGNLMEDVPALAEQVRARSALLEALLREARPWVEGADLGDRIDSACPPGGGEGGA